MVSQRNDHEVHFFQIHKSKQGKDILQQDRIMRVSPFLFLRTFNRIQTVAEEKHGKTKGLFVSRTIVAWLPLFSTWNYLVELKPDQVSFLHLDCSCPVWLDCNELDNKFCFNATVDDLVSLSFLFGLIATITEIRIVFNARVCDRNQTILSLTSFDSSLT